MEIVPFSARCNYRDLDGAWIPAVLADVCHGGEDTVPLICLIDTGMQANLLPARMLRYYGLNYFELEPARGTHWPVVIRCADPCSSR
jgi:hypothetical protein